MGGRDEATKRERRTVEKNRRIHMNSLFFKLSSLVPKDHQFSSRGTLSHHDCLDQTASYIKYMKEKIERLKQRKEMATGEQMNNPERISNVKLPMVEVRHQDSSLEVLLISKHNKTFDFHEVISTLEEGGVEVLNASSSVVGDKIFGSIQGQQLCSTVGQVAS